MYGNLLPIGSVVLLKGADKRVCVIGRIQALVGNDVVYDYSAVPFPEGVVDPRSIVFFKHDDIARVYFIGCQDAEELRYREEVLANLGELYIDENGQIAERAKEDEAASEPAPETDEPEAPVFADVE